MSRTGMFLPRRVEEVLAQLPGPRSRAVRASLALVVILMLTVGAAFALRAYTVARLPLWSNGRVAVLAVLPGDRLMLEHRMEDVLQMPEVESRLDAGTGAILGYIVPTRYVMQGMIADTGPEYRLYEHHQAMPMIADWIFHPFQHLEGGHAMMHHMTGGAAASGSPGVRRIIFLRVQSGGAANEPSSLFAIDGVRVPQFYVDVDMHTLTLLDVRDLGPGTGWGRVPTPMF
jgi:hypothetical protein